MDQELEQEIECLADLARRHDEVLEQLEHLEEKIAEAIREYQAEDTVPSEIV